MIRDCGLTLGKAEFTLNQVDKVSNPERLSVTGIISSYHVFDRDFWLAYKTLERLLDKDKFDEIKISLMKRKLVDDSILELVDKQQYEIEKSLLDAEWRIKSEEAKNLGTTVHELIHNLFCTNLKELKTSYKIDTDSYLVRNLDLFLESESGLFPEFKMIYTPVEGVEIVGVADLIIKKNGNRVTIIDWKTSDEGIKFKSHYDLGKKKNKSFKYPISKLDDCSGVQYLLQLSIYAYLLKQMDPNIIIDELIIVWVKDGRAFKEYPVTYLEKETEKLIDWHVRNHLLQLELDKCKLKEY